MFRILYKPYRIEEQKMLIAGTGPSARRWLGGGRRSVR